jgi:predicted DsbA family dithiol-disulfide isomerase
MEEPMIVPITITSDFICPWCLIGERRLLAAITSLPEGIALATEWLPYELNPEMPVGGMDRKTYRTLKFGSWERSRALDAQTVAAASDTDVSFDYNAIARTPNTFLAHRLSWLAAQEGKQRAVVDAILSAYFERGRDIGDLETLIAVAGEHGLDRVRTATALRGDAGIDDARRLEAEAPHRGVRGVPHFEIGETAIGGAQSVVVLRNAILANMHG